MTFRQLHWSTGGAKRVRLAGLLLLIFPILPASSVGAKAHLLAGEAIGRRQIVLADGWLVRQLDSEKPDTAALVRESRSPDNQWLSARMPAQVHDVLLAHGRITDPHLYLAGFHVRVLRPSP